MRRITKGIGRRELAAIVHDTLKGAGIDAVLVGGSVAALYSKEKYVTDDLDFVSYKPLKTIVPVMEELGFKMIGNRALHPSTELYVPLVARQRQIDLARVRELSRREGKLHPFKTFEARLAAP